MAERLTGSGPNKSPEPLGGRGSARAAGTLTNCNISGDIESPDHVGSRGWS